MDPRHEEKKGKQVKKDLNSNGVRGITSHSKQEKLSERRLEKKKQRGKRERGGMRARDVSSWGGKADVNESSLNLGGPVFKQGGERGIKYVGGGEETAGYTR